MRPDSRPWLNRLAIVVGGGLGAAVRYGVGEQLADPVPPSFPWTTFGVNLTGALLIGFVATMLTTAWADTVYVRALVVTGALGGLTTWSHFVVEVDQLWSADQAMLAVTYAASSIVLGIALAGAGVALARSRGGGPAEAEVR